MKSRVKKFFYYMWDKKLTVSSAAIILAATGLLSNILGLFRDRLIAGHFGASHQTDIFYASFGIPDLIFNLLILGALSTVFIPIFIEKMTKRNQQEVQKFANSFLNFILLASIIFSIVLFILTPKIVPLLLAGFFHQKINSDFNVYQVTVNMMRLMLLSPILFSISGILGGILNSHRKFIAYSLVPIVYNLAIIFSMIFLVDKFNPEIYAPAIGVIVGAFLTVLIQLPSTIVTGWRWQPIISFEKGEVAKIIKMMTPRTLALGAGQINKLIDLFVLAFIPAGISVAHYADNIQTVPTVIFGIAIATAIFPALSESHAKGNMKVFLSQFSWSARRILFFMIPSTVGIIVLRAQIIRLIFGVGHFDWNATYWTTKTLLFYAFGLVAWGLYPLLLKAFFAIKNTKTPFYISLAVMILNGVLSLTLPFAPSLGLGVAGVAFAYSISGIASAVLLFIFLHEKIGVLDPDHKIFESTTRLVVASIFMGIVIHYSLYLFDIFTNTQKVVGLFLQTSGAIALGGITYFFLAWLFRCEEIQYIFEKISRFKPTKAELEETQTL